MLSNVIENEIQFPLITHMEKVIIQINKYEILLKNEIVLLEWRSVWINIQESFKQQRKIEAGTYI